MGEPAEESSTSAASSVSASAPSTTLAPTPAPTTSSIPSASSVTTTPKPTPAPTPALTPATPALECGSCTACLANNGVCYPETKGFCDLYPQYTWCGGLGHANLRR